MLLDPHRLEEQLRDATAIDAGVRDPYLTFAHAQFPGGTTVRPAGHGYIERELRFEAKGDWLYSAVLNQKWVLWYFRKPALNAGLIDPGKTKRAISRFGRNVTWGNQASRSYFGRGACCVEMGRR